MRIEGYGCHVERWHIRNDGSSDCTSGALWFYINIYMKDRGIDVGN